MTKYKSEIFTRAQAFKYIDAVTNHKSMAKKRINARKWLSGLKCVTISRDRVQDYIMDKA